MKTRLENIFSQNRYSRCDNDASISSRQTIPISVLKTPESSVETTLSLCTKTAETQSLCSEAKG